MLDLKIEEGLITGLVIGSKLYKVKVKNDLLGDGRKADIANSVGRRIDSVSDLIEGKFPLEMGELFLTQKKGLFPSPKEIHMDCSCPDWAGMCKHIAAVLYGVGVRLDEDPILFFKLRGIDMNSFIKASIDEKVGSLLKNAGKKTGRVMNDADITEIFGV